MLTCAKRYLNRYRNSTKLRYLYRLSQQCASQKGVSSVDVHCDGTKYPSKAKRTIVPWLYTTIFICIILQNRKLNPRNQWLNPCASKSVCFCLQLTSFPPTTTVALIWYTYVVYGYLSKQSANISRYLCICGSQ